MKRNPLNWTNCLFFCGTLLVAVLGVPLYLHFYDLHWPIIAVSVVYYMLGGMCITGGYHRLLAHGSYECSTWLKLFYLIFGASTFEGPALVWCTDHRNHHRHIDSDKDPYNIKRGFFYAHMGWILRAGHADYEKLAPADLLEDRWVMWQYRHYVLLASFMSFGLPILIGLLLENALAGLLFPGVLRLVCIQHGTFLINSYCHSIGRQPYSEKISARDSFWIAFFTFGEGYHNFHHQFQIDYRNGIHWYQWDPTKWWIRFTAWLGASSKLRAVSAQRILRARTELDSQRLVRWGISADTIRGFQERIENAHHRLVELREESKRLSQGVHSASKNRLLQLRAEMKVARIEARAAFAQWVAYTKTLRSLSRATPQIPAI